MFKGLKLLSLLLLATSSHAAVDNQIIKSEAASAIALAGRIGEAAMFSVQADDDDDLEIFATASSKTDEQNDYWLLLDWDGIDYKIMNTGKVLTNGNFYLTSHQVSKTELMLGQKNGALTSMTFTDLPDVENLKVPENPIPVPHSIDAKVTLLSNLHSDLNGDLSIDTDIKSIVTLEGTDQQNYTVICTENLIHTLHNDQEVATLKFTLEQGGYCQSGNIDNTKLGEAPNLYIDQELITQDGLYFTFDGTNWLEKTGLSTDNFGENFLVANINDDVDEIISRNQTEQLHSFSPTGGSNWVFISALENAKGTFNLININNDDTSEIFFESFDSQLSSATKINKVTWNTGSDSHALLSEDISHSRIYKIKRLATRIENDTETNFYLFASESGTHKPSSKLLTRISETDLSTQSNITLFNTKSRSFDVIAKTTKGDSIANYSIVQLDQLDLTGGNYDFVYKFLAASDFSINNPVNLEFNNPITPDFSMSNITTISALVAADYNKDGLDDLHAGGEIGLGLDLSEGIVHTHHIDALIDSSVFNTSSIKSVSALHVGDIDRDSNSIADMIATGESISSDKSITIEMLRDGTKYKAEFTPESPDDNAKIYFKSIFAADFKGFENFEVLGLHNNQLALYDTNAVDGESQFYNLINFDFTDVTPITLNEDEHDYQLALASDISGMLYIIKPKDFSILHRVKACESETTDLTSTQIDNDVTIAFALCGQQILSWVVEYRENELEDGYNLHALATHELGDIDTSGGKLITLQTNEIEEVIEEENTVEVSVTKTHLIALFNDTFKRFELNRALGGNDDANGDDGLWDGIDDEEKDNEPYPYYNYQDEYPLVASQWADSDRDGYGDNQASKVNPDPSLNDFDNDGEKDSTDPDNIPVNDFDKDNDVDNGLPYFLEKDLTAEENLIKVQVLTPVKAQYAGELTTIHIKPPTTEDIYDNFFNNTNPAPFASMQGISLLNTGSAGNFEARLAPGKHSILWQAQDTAGNIGTITQEAWIYPTVAFEVPEQRIGEKQVNQIKLVLNAPFPDINNLPTVSIRVTGGSISNDDITEDITQDITVRFLEGETMAFVPLNFINDDITEGDETIQLTIVDNFDSTSESPNLQVDSQKQVTTVTVVDVNEAPFIEQLLNIKQNKTWVSIPNNINGVITLSINTSDNNTIDTLNYSWDLTSLGIENPVLLPTVSIDPALFDPSIFPINVTVTDDGLPARSTTASFLLSVVYGDSDGDGTFDNLDAFPHDAEETADKDGDGHGDEADLFDDDITEWADADGDGHGDNIDPFDNDKTEWADADGDKHGDNSDLFDGDATEWADADGDGHGDNIDVFDNNASEWADADGDGHGDNIDLFDDNANEWADADGDGHGDNIDQFDNDKTEWADADGDKHGDNSDVFDNDATEWADADGDGHGDNIDVFDNDATEWADADGDGHGDNIDPFDNDATEWADADGDGHGDNIDLFDDNINEWQDTDGDGVGDNSDDFPKDATRARTSTDQSLSKDGAGSINYLLMLLMASLLWFRRKP
jgi:hypothetical protein